MLQFLGCDYGELVGNGHCNDETNNAECIYDGGDCCGGLIVGSSCKYFVIDKYQMPRENNSSISYKL